MFNLLLQYAFQKNVTNKAAYPRKAHEEIMFNVYSLFNINNNKLAVTIIKQLKNV